MLTSLSVLGTRIVFAGSLRGFCAGGAGMGAAGLFAPDTGFVGGGVRAGGGGGFGRTFAGAGRGGGGGGITSFRARAGGGPGGGGGLDIAVDAIPLSFAWRPVGAVFVSTSIFVLVAADDP